MASAVKIMLLMVLMEYLLHLSEQLQDEINLTTSAIIVKLSAQGWNINKLTQRIDGIRMECIRFVCKLYGRDHQLRRPFF
jgi:hypothetical protein